MRTVQELHELCIQKFSENLESFKNEVDAMPRSFVIDDSNPDLMERSDKANERITTLTDNNSFILQTFQNIRSLDIRDIQEAYSQIEAMR